jgi:hypothetical protein
MLFVQLRIAVLLMPSTDASHECEYHRVPVVWLLRSDDTTYHPHYERKKQESATTTATILAKEDRRQTLLPGRRCEEQVLEKGTTNFAKR